MSLKKNLFGNGIANILQKFVRTLEQLVMVPFFITAWGKAYYGEWLTLTIIPSIIAFSDLGFGSAAANSFVLKYASGEKQEAANIARTGIYITTLTVLGGVLISCIGMFVLSELNVFDKTLITASDAIWAVSILILAKLIGFFTQLFEAYFRAARKAALAVNLTSANAVLNLASGIVILQMGYGIVIFSLSQLIVAVLFNLFYAYKAKKTLNLDVKGRIDNEHKKSILRKGLGYLMSPIWQSLYFQGTTFVVRITLGPEAVAVFNTVRTVCRSINQVFTMINGTVFPELQFEIGAGNMPRAHKLFRVAVWAAFICAVLGVLFLLFFGETFYNIWTKNQLVVPGPVWNIFMIGILFNAMWWTAGVAFRAVNKPYALAFMGVIASVLSVVSSYFLSLKFGLTGAAIGGLVLDVVMAIYILPVSAGLLGITVKEVFQNGGKDILGLLEIIRSKIPVLRK